MSQRFAARHAMNSLVVVALLATAGVASAQSGSKPKPPTITKAVAKEVAAAQAAIKAEKWTDCVAALVPTDAAANKTPYDDFAVSELRMSCSARAQDLAVLEPALARSIEVGEANGFLDAETVASRRLSLTRVNFQNKDYPRTIAVGERALQANPANGDQVRDLVTRAKFLTNDYAGTATFVEAWVADQEKRGVKPDDTALGVWASACVRLKDNACVTKAVDKQVRYAPNREAWNNLTLLLLRSAPQDRTLQVLRFADEIGSLEEADQVTEYASLCMEKGFPGEAEGALQRGIDAGKFGPKESLPAGTRSLQQTARTQATSDRASLPKLAKEAAAQKTGTAEVRLGQAYFGYGQYAEAIAAIERGLAKGGVKDVPEANLSLGIAKLRAGDKAGASAAFDAVKGDDFLQRLAGYWNLRTR
jgi:tetratricopeptide (TPR) repeat protein